MTIRGFTKDAINRVEMWKRLVSLGIFLSIVCSLSAQNARERAIGAIDDLTLKKGCLVFVLKTNNAKIKKLEELSRRKEAQKLLEETEVEQQKWITAFGNLFTFCPVHFLPDTALHQFQQRPNCTRFVNVDLKFGCDSNFKAQNPIYFIRIDKTNSETTTGVEAIVINDFKMKPLERPFPYFARLNNFQNFFLQLVNRGRKFSKIVTSLNDDLVIYAAKKDKIIQID